MEWAEIAVYAPIVTAAVALAAFVTAVFSIKTQRSVARKRAALDLFFKTEMDGAMVEANLKFENALSALDEAPSIDEFYKRNREHYIHICSYLDVQELIAVGIHTGVLDEAVCFAYWSDELIDAHKNGKRVIDHARTHGVGSSYTYADLEKLSESWEKRTRKIKKHL